MPARALVHVEVELAEAVGARMHERPRPVLSALGGQHANLVLFGRRIASQNLADADIGSMQRILLSEGGILLRFQAQALRRERAHGHVIKKIEQPAVVDVGVRGKGVLGHCVPLGHQPTEYPHHLVPIAGIARIHKETLSPAADDRRVGPRGRLDHGDLCVVRDPVRRDAWREPLAAIPAQQLRELVDRLECAVGREVPFGQGLHREVDVDLELVLLGLADIHVARERAGKGVVKDGVVKDALGTRIHAPDLADPGYLVHEARQSLVRRREKPHPIVLVRQAVFRHRLLARGHIDDVDVEAAHDLEHAHDRPGHVGDLKLEHHNRGALVGRTIEEATARKLCLERCMLLGRALHLDEDGVLVDRLVVAHARDVEPLAGNRTTGGEKRAHMVVDRGRIGLLHERSSRMIIGDDNRGRFPFVTSISPAQRRTPRAASPRARRLRPRLR